MEFNPDEYLKESFNPDAYLNEFNPDEYLSGETKQPSLVDKIPGLAPEVQYVPPTLSEKAVGVGEGALNVLTGIPGSLFGGPVGVLNTITGNLVSNQKKDIQQGFLEGMEALTYHPKTETGEEYQRKYIAPVMEAMMAVAPVMHGEMSAKSSARMLHDQVAGGKKGAVPIVEEPRNLDDVKAAVEATPDIEKSLMERQHKFINDKIEQTVRQIETIEKSVDRTGGDVSPELVKLLDDNATLLERLEKDKSKIEEILGIEKEEVVKAADETPIVEEITLPEIVEDIAKTPDEVVPTETITVEAPKPTSIQEILDTTAMDKTPVFDAIVNATDLVTKVKDSEIYFDNTIGSSMQKIIMHFMDVTGLSKERVAFVRDSGLDMVGRLTHEGDTSIIRLKAPEMANMVNRAIKNIQEIKPNLFPKELFGKKLEAARYAFADVRVAAHEIGHLMLNRHWKATVTRPQEFFHLKRQYADYLKNNTPEFVSIFDAHAKKNIMERQKDFHEFFAENVAKELLYKHTIGAFNPFRKSFQTLIDSSVKYLKEYGIDIDSKTFSSELVSDLITKNQDAMQKTAQTVFEKMERETNDKLFFGDKTLEDVLRTWQRGASIAAGGSLPFGEGKAPHNMANISTRAAMLLGKGLTVTGNKFFGRNKLAQFFRDNPEVQKAADIIWKAEEWSTAKINELWHGKQRVGDVKWTQVLSKVHAGDSPYMMLKQAKNADLKVVHDLFKKGFEQELPYERNIELNGQSLTKPQLDLYNSLSRLFKGMYDISAEKQNLLGKKNVLPYRDGWYPAVRNGEFAIEVGYGGNIAYRQHFPTRVAAENWLRKIDKKSLKHMEVSDVIDTTREQITTNREMAEIIMDKLSRSDVFKDDMAAREAVDRLLANMDARGGKLGSHHMYRFNLEGYKGSELFKSAEEAGKSFGEAIEFSVAEKQRQIAGLEIQTGIKPILESGLHPNAEVVIQQMYDNSLNRNTNYMKELESGMHYGIDKIARSISENLFQREYKGDKSAFSTMHEGFMEMFYLTKMMPKAVFSVIGQVLSTPYVISRLSYDGHGLRAYHSFAKGLTKLAAGDKELWNNIKDISQKYDVFEPQFMEAMALKEAKSPTMKFIKDWVLMQAPGKASDAISRVVTYAVAYEHYKDIGHKPHQASLMARKTVGDTMNLYGKQDSAAIFSHAGMVGDMVKPLQGFGQNMLGNLIADVKYMKATDYKTWGPLVNYALVTVATGGVMSSMFIQEYEAFRKFVNTKFNDFTLPSIMDIFASDDGFLNRIEPLPEDARKAVMYGLPALTGIDLASSVRANQTLFSMLVGIAGGWEDAKAAIPVMSYAADIVGTGDDLVSAAMGNKTNAELKKSLDAILPAGHLGYGVKELLDTNTTQLMGSPTDNIQVGTKGKADMPRTTTDIVAGVMGTKSTEQKYTDQLLLEMDQKNKMMESRKERAAIMYVETGDPKYINKMVDLGMTQKEIKNRIDTEIANKTLPQELRSYANKGGKVTKGKGERNIQQIFKFGQGQ